MLKVVHAVPHNYHNKLHCSHVCFLDFRIFFTVVIDPFPKVFIGKFFIFVDKCLYMESTSYM